MNITGDYLVGLICLTNGKGETKRYVRRRAIPHAFQPHLALVSRTQATRLSGMDGNPFLAGDRFPGTVVVDQSVQAAGAGAWAYTPDERAYWIREQIGALESATGGPDAAAITESLRAAKPEFAWDLAEVKAELQEYVREGIRDS
ncbi:MAG TPA: hypothetical protein VMS17_09390 [Gemmataceae bacterium]|nr:hypothetical protein [Gemmataceae bacterium]